jgi:nicotinamide riboside kinase
MVTILITGPECSGKTSLAQDLKNRLGGLMIVEAAREYLDGNEVYDQSDLLEIAKLQNSSEAKARIENPNFLIADTGMLVLSIWSEEKYSHIDPWIESQLRKSEYDIVFLCRPDLPWEHDPQRENPTDRDRLFNLYIDKLTALNRTYLIIEGEGIGRVQKALDHLKQKGHITY